MDRKSTIYVKPLSILFLLLLLSGCSDSDSVDIPAGSTRTISTVWDEVPPTPRPDGDLCDRSYFSRYPTWEQQKANPPVSSGVGYGMGADDVSGGELIGLQTYLVDAHTPMTATFSMMYPRFNTETLSLRFLALLNETQLTDAFPDSPTPYYDLDLVPADDEITVTFHIPPLEPGMNDFIIVAVPQNGYGYVVHTYRITLIAGGEQALLPRDYTVLPRDGLISQRHIQMHGFEMSFSPDSLYEIPTWDTNSNLEVTAGNPINYYIYAGYTYVDNGDAPFLENPDHALFSLLMFVDDQQVSVHPDYPVYYGEVDNNTAFARIKATIQTEGLAAATHEVLALRIDFPGFPMCILSGGPANGYLIPYRVSPRQTNFEVVP